MASMRRFSWCFVFILASGCGDPESSRFAIGQKVLAIPHKKDDDRVFLDHDAFKALTAGTHLTVVRDEDDPTKDWTSRQVHVHVDDGAFNGLDGKVTRWSLRAE
jgi:hypothetical protein